MIRRLDSKPCCKAQQLLRGYDRLRLPQPHVHANRRNKASPFMTGPFVPVGILNPIRAVVGIPIIDSTFSSNALGFVVGRLLDAFDKHASGVSALQYSRNIRMARRRGAWGSAPGTTTGRSLGQSAPAAEQQSDCAGLLSVSFSTAPQGNPQR